MESRRSTPPAGSLLVLLGGPSCSGKSTVARVVCQALPRGACGVLALDCYYRDLSHLQPPDRAKANFDHPDAIDWPLLKDHIVRWRAGGSVRAPIYDFADHVRGAETVETPAAPIVIVEGILALHDPGLNAMAGLRVFLDLPDETCLERRIKRDLAERGRSEESVRRQFEASVLPMAESFMRPTKRHADVVLDGTDSLATLARRVIERIPAPYPQ